MNKRDLEYIFWLKAWKDKTQRRITSGQFKCIITRRRISIIPVERDPAKELNVDLSAIHTCKIVSARQYPVQSVELFLNDRKIILIPVNPFDPSHVLNGNQNESSAIISTIDAFRSNMDPQANTNPYARQMAMKDNIKWSATFDQLLMRDNLKRVEAFNQDWDAHTSPWTYFDLYGDKFLFVKTIAKIIAVVLLAAIIMVLLILAIAYVLDILNII